MHDTSRDDESLLASIAELRAYLDAWIAAERRLVEEWMSATGGEVGARPIAEEGGRGSASPLTPGRGVGWSGRGEGEGEAAPVGPRRPAAPSGAGQGGAAREGEAEDPRKRLDALARRLDGRAGRSRGTSTGGA